MLSEAVGIDGSVYAQGMHVQVITARGKWAILIQVVLLWPMHLARTVVHLRVLVQHAAVPWAVKDDCMVLLDM